MFSLSLPLSSCVFFFSLPLLLSSYSSFFSSFSSTKTIGNEEDGGGYDVSGDFSMIYNIAVVDLWWILVKKGLELVFCFDGYEILD
ncbi:unnamed protein product [Lathyrus oleraceus]